MKEYKYKINGNTYNVAIGDIEDNVAKVEVNGVPYTVELEAAKAATVKSQAGVKKIRVHDIRHSAVSLLINMGFSVLAIGERMGHEAEKITYRYAHLFPTVQTEMAEKLEMERMTKEENPLLLQGQSHFPAENRED